MPARPSTRGLDEHDRTASNASVQMYDGKLARQFATIQNKTANLTSHTDVI
jgi:hypothetical protein